MMMKPAEAKVTTAPQRVIGARAGSIQESTRVPSHVNRLLKGISSKGQQRSNFTCGIPTFCLVTLHVSKPGGATRNMCTMPVTHTSADHPMVS